jgi:hypothetical protein
MKIGITLDMSKAFWVNGMQQHIVFLYDLFSRIGHDCYYISKEPPKHKMHKKHKAMTFIDIVEDKSENFDLIIIAGFDIPLESIIKLKDRNKNLKIVVAHFGHKLYIDSFNTMFSPRYNNTNIKLNPKIMGKLIDQIWMLPHHKSSVEYTKAYYDNDNVVITPMIWEPSFVQDKIKELKQKKLNPLFDKESVRKICIFEPNTNMIKNCFIPIMICERLESKNPGHIESINIFCADKIRERQYFAAHVNRLNILQKDDFCYFNGRWGSLNAISKFGKTIVSHQVECEYNYATFEQLYMGLPVIHNCPSLSSVGYYYPHNDITMAANQLYSATINHEEEHDKYKLQAREKLKQFSPFELSNINAFKSLLSEIFK